MSVGLDSTDGFEPLLRGEEHRGFESLPGSQPARASTLNEGLEAEGVSGGGLKDGHIEVEPAAVGGEEPAA